MDDITASVKEMYEKYPYPSGVPTLRAANDVRLLLSYGEQARSSSGKLNALDAGCGRGLGLISNASVQKDVNFIGIDINSTAIKEARENVLARNLNNVCFQECDLMTLEGVKVPPGGFDVIYSSGALHHLSCPKTGLENLKKSLAPHGIISFMVYGSYGRMPLYRLLEAIDIVVSRSLRIEDRLKPARLLAHVAEETIFKENYWQNTATANDIEFVDRCLNMNETSYDIAALWKLLEESGMKFLRWVEPDDWSVEKLFDDAGLINYLKKLNQIDQFKVIERLFSRPMLDLVISHDTNSLRSEVGPDDVDQTAFAVNPDVSFQVEKRNHRDNQRIESLHYILRSREKELVRKGVLAQVMLILVDQTTPFNGESMIQLLAQNGIEKAETKKVLVELVKREMLYRPHQADI